jgi:hypothetical protein
LISQLGEAGRIEHLGTFLPVAGHFC